MVNIAVSPLMPYPPRGTARLFGWLFYVGYFWEQTFAYFRADWRLSTQLGLTAHPRPQW